MSILIDPMFISQAERIELGREGENWVADNERRRLAGTPFGDMIKVSSRGQKSSFDIKSYSPDGKIINIEVKTTEGDVMSAFSMSAEELAFAEHCAEYGIPYELHRVHHMKDAKHRGEVVCSAGEVISMFERIPTQYLLRAKPMESNASGNGPEYLPWEDCADRIPGTLCKFYLAKIVGPDEVFAFERRLVHGRYDYTCDKVWFSCMIESNGVYEATRRWIDENGFDIQRQRHWFRLIDGRAYDLEYNEVLDAVAQCEGWNGGAALCC